MRQKGFTLIEMLLVLVIVSLSVTLALPYVSRTLDEMKLKTSVRRVEAAMKYASALSHQSRSVYSVRASGAVLLLSGKGEDKEVLFPDGVKIESMNAVLFYPEGGSSGGAFKISSDNDSYAVKVEPYTGLVKVRVEN